MSSEKEKKMVPVAAPAIKKPFQAGIREQVMWLLTKWLIAKQAGVCVQVGAELQGMLSSGDLQQKINIVKIF